MKTPKRYTKLRQFYAWFGFCSILIAIPALITAIVWILKYVQNAGLN